MPEPVFQLAVHGGAGVIERSQITPEREGALRAGIKAALQIGGEILRRGGCSLDAVEAAVRVLEDNPLFNAGRGAAFTGAGTQETDAAVMDGRTRSAGAVACVQRVRNPIVLARAVMEKSGHVLLVGAGAENFAEAHGIERMSAEYFFTQERWDALERIREAVPAGGATGKTVVLSDAERHGTVGAVARDFEGNLAAATSTGGMTNKLPGRVGDSPLIGAGTFADNATCAVSCTGDGEFFIRGAVAYEVGALIKYRRLPLREAADEALARVAKLGGAGGLIAVDRDGNLALPFNTNGMYRGFLDRERGAVVDIYSEPRI